MLKRMLGVDADRDTLEVLPIDGGEESRRRARRRRDGSDRRRPRWLLPAAVTMALVIVAVVQFWPSGTDAPTPQDPDGGGAVEAADAVDFDGLIDGETLPILVEGLPHSVQTVTVQCVPGGTEVFALCDPTTARRSTSSPNGTLETETRVWRVISTLEYGKYDCARRPCELRTYPPRPVASVATSSLGFDPQNTGALPPDIYTVDPSPSSEDTITVRSDALVPGTDVTVRGCTSRPGDDPIGCTLVFAATVTVADAGFEYEIDPSVWYDITSSSCESNCRIEFAIDGLRRQPFAIHLPSSDRAGFLIPNGADDVPLEISITPSTGLLDGQQVTLSAAGVTSQMGLYLCTEAANFDCSWLGTPETADVQTLAIPRAFVSWLGGVRDCAELTCEVVVLGPMNFETRVAAAVDFDASVPLTPGRPLTIDEPGLIADGQRVVLSIDPNEGAMEWPNITVCARDVPQACEYVDGNFSDNAVTATLFRTLTTPIGPYDCVDDGPCELMAWIDSSATRFEPLALDFDPSAPPARTPVTVVLRPGGPLSDGDVTSLTVRGIPEEEQVLFANLCLAGESRCAFLGSIDRRAGTAATFTVRLRRIVTMQSPLAPGLGTPVDCLDAECEIRLTNLRTAEPVPLTFRDEDPLPRPQVALGTPGALPTGEPIRIQGRRFSFFGLEQQEWLEAHLCRPGAEPDTWTGCYSVGAITRGAIDTARGAFDATISIPRVIPDFGPFGDSQPCETDCLLVVYDGLGEPATLPVTVDR